MDASKPLDERAQRALLRLARQAIDAHLTGTEPPQPDPRDASLARPAGAFVTLHTRGQLRGCIGRMQATSSMAATVREMAVAAAAEDPRFPPLDASELPGAEIEISVLSPMHPIDPADVEAGLHGLVVSRGARRGVLLPQVPGAYGWDRERFLAETCHKAGLPADAWRDPRTELLAFTAQVFSEAELGRPPARAAGR